MTPKLVISHRVQKWQLLHMKIMQNYCFFFVEKSKYSIWRYCCHRYLMVFRQCRSLHNKQNNTWLLGEMESLFSCLTQHSVSLVPCPHSKGIELHTQREISELHALITKTFMVTQHVEKIIVGKAREIIQLTWQKHPISAFLIEHIQVWFTAFCGIFFPVWNSVTIKWWELCTTNSLQF